MMFDDKESPQFEFNDPSELFNLINRKYASNGDPGYADFKQAEDMINFSNPDEHPDWAKEINEKHGVTFGAPQNNTVAGNLSPESDASLNIPKLYEQLVDIKSKKNAPDLESDSEKEPNRSPAGLFTDDEIYEMSKPAKYKSPETIQKEKELERHKELIKSYRDAGVKDSDQLVPLYNKLSTLEQDLLNPEPLKAQPPAIKKQPEAASEPSSIKTKLDLDKDWEDIAAGISGASSAASTQFPKFNPLSAIDRKELFGEVVPGDSLQANKDLKAASDRAVYDLPVSKTSSADDRITRLEQKIEQDKQDQARELEEQINLQKQQSEANKQALYEAQSDSAEYRRYNALFNALNKIGAGIGGAISKTKVEVPELDPILERAADQRMKEYKERVAMEQEDPDSLYSKSFRNFAKPLVKKLNMNPMVLEGLSGKQISDIMPHIKSMYDTQVTGEYRKQVAEEARANRALEREKMDQYRNDVKTNERFDKAGKMLISELASARSTFGTDSRTLAATQNIRALFQGRDLNDLDNREVYEVAKSLDRVLSQTGATISGTKSLTPDTARGWMAKALEYVTNKRQGANASSFLTQFEKNLDREERTAEARIKKTQRRILTNFSDLQNKDPDKWKLMMRQHNLPENPFEEEKSAPKLGPDEVMGRDSKTGRPVILNKKTKQVRWAD